MNSESSPSRKRTSYWDYIRVESLLDLQSGIDADERRLSDDEVRFIVIHQVDELWMKLALRELVSARDVFKADHVPETQLSAVADGLHRVTLIFQLMAGHFRLMETMRTQNYLEFRDKLSPASGFQSAQMREIEILIGLDDRDRIPFGEEGSYLDALKGDDGERSPAFLRVQQRLADRPTLKDAVYRWLARAPIQGSSPGSPDDDRVVDAWIEEFIAQLRAGASEREAIFIDRQALAAGDVARLRDRYRAESARAAAYLRAEDVADAAEARRIRRLRAAILYIESYRELPLLSWPGEIIDSLVAAEQAMLVFRQRHARMVERVIGRRVGTGGSAGVDYLDSTAIGYRVFKEIWAARTMLLPAEQCPPIANEEFYRLRSE